MTDVTNTSTESARYSHPSNPNIILWELPGLNTPKYPDVKIYCQKFKLNWYNAFLLFTSGRFTGSDLEIAKRLHSMKKPFLIVRTKIDVDFLNEMLKKKIDENELLKTITDDILENTVDLGCTGENIFLISNFHRDRWDFCQLNDAILSRFSSAHSTVGCLPVPSRKTKLTPCLEQTGQQEPTTSASESSSELSHGEKRINKGNSSILIQRYFVSPCIKYFTNRSQLIDLVLKKS